MCIGALHGGECIAPTAHSLGSLVTATSLWQPIFNLVPDGPENVGTLLVYIYAPEIGITGCQYRCMPKQYVLACPPCSPAKHNGHTYNDALEHIVYKYICIAHISFSPYLDACKQSVCAPKLIWPFWIGGTPGCSHYPPIALH